MIKWFEVENFKSIKKLHLDFLPFMVFVGPNGAGKTNIVQSLSLMLDILADGSTEPVEMYGGYEQLILRRKQSARSGIRLALSWPVVYKSGLSLESENRFDAEFDITLKFSTEGGFAQFSRESVTLRRSGKTEFSYCFIGNDLQEFHFEEHSQIGEMLGYRLPTISKEAMQKRFGGIDSTSLKWTYIFPPQIWRGMPIATRLRLDSSSLRSDSSLGAIRQRRSLGLSGEGLPSAIDRLRKKNGPGQEVFRQILRKLQEVYPRIEDVSAVQYQPGKVALSFKEHKIDGRLGEASVSDGVIHALALLVALEDSYQKRGSPQILIIEEPENALHPWALQKIIGAAQDRINRSEPLLLTTHSPVLVNTVTNPESLYIVENDEKKGTVAIPALEREHALRTILAGSGQKLGDLWIDGTLGGIPGVGIE